MANLHRLHKNQSGLVSLTVSIIFILVISIVTTSFAFLMRREARQSLDRQLSTQAFYAAESGLNDAAKAIEAGGVSPNNGCDQQSQTGLSNQLDGDTFQYTCLLIDNAPTELRYDNVGVDETTVVKLDSATDPIKKIRLSWQAAEGYATGAQDVDIFAGSNNHDLPNYEVYGPDNSGQNFAKNTGILRSTVVPITNYSRASLTSGARTFFMYPNQSGTSSISYSAGDADGSFIDGNCALNNTPRNCSAEITNLPGTDVVYLRLSSIYKASSITIEAFNEANEPLQLVDTQYQVDSTGRANDVLRRIQARIPRTEDYYFPEFALETSEGICKRMLVYQNSVGLDPSASGEPACSLTVD